MDGNPCNSLLHSIISREGEEDFYDLNYDKCGPFFLNREW